MARKAAPTHAKNADLTAHKTAFVQWLVSEQKEPATQRELALVLGVDGATLSDWKRDSYVVGLLQQFEARFVAEKARAQANLLRLATQTRNPMAAIAAYDKLARTFGWYATEKHEISGRMTLGDFLAQGGFTREEEQRPRVN